MTKRSTAEFESTDDYRSIHLQRGGSYDSALASSPFDAYMAQLEKSYVTETIPKLFPGRPPRCLDFACGTGRITQDLVSLCSETVGVDISPTMLDEARLKCPSARFVQTDLTKDEADLGQFDLITSFRFFGNAQQELRSAVLVKLNRLLRTNGYLIINSHRNPHSIAAMLKKVAGIDHGFDLSYFKLKRLLGEFGFDIERRRPIGAWMIRSRLMASDPSAARSRQLEANWQHPSLSIIAPDTIVVAKKVREA
jgi:SAM-dependent methyltransferase